MFFNFTSFCGEEGEEATDSVIGRWCIRRNYKFAFNNYMHKMKNHSEYCPLGCDAV